MPRILIVEDDATLLGALKAKLINAGYEVATAEDGQKALEMIKEKPDAVLLDILLPKKSGMEILKEMQLLPGLSDMPVIIISNSGQAVEIEEARRLGAKDFLIKTDFTPQEVLAKLARFVPPPIGAFGAAKKTESPAGASEKQTAGGPHKGTVLVVEDDSFLRKLLVQKLIREGFRTEEAPGGKEALEYLKREVPTIALLDLVMPGIDGFQVLQEIRKDARTKNTPVIVLSNLGEQENIDRAKALGADDYLIKAHFILDEIIGRVSSLIAKRYI